MDSAFVYPRLFLFDFSFLNKILKKECVCVWVGTCPQVWVPTEARGGHQIPWNQNDKWF